MATWTKEVVSLAIAGDSLTIDDIIIDGSNIGHTDDTDLLALADGALTVNGTVTSTGTITGTLATASQPNITSVGGNFAIGGDLTVTGNDIKSSGGTTAITLSGADADIVGNLTIGNQLTFSNGEIISNAENGNFIFYVHGANRGFIKINSDTNEDSFVSLEDAGSRRVHFGWDYSTTSFVVNFDASASVLDSGSTQALVLDTSGNMTIAGDLKVLGNDIKSSTGSTVMTFSGYDVTLADDLTVSGDVAITGDLAINGGNITNAFTCDKVVTFTRGVVLGTGGTVDSVQLLVGLLNIPSTKGGLIEVESQSGATDDLDGIIIETAQPANGTVLYIRAKDGHTITVRTDAHSGNSQTASRTIRADINAGDTSTPHALTRATSFVLSSVVDVLHLIYSGGRWVVMGHNVTSITTGD